MADDEVDLASGLLWGAGVSAVAEHPHGPGRVRLRTDVPDGGAAAIEGALGGRWAVRVVEVADDGLDAWRAHAEAVAVGRRLVVRPPWVPLGPQAPGVAVLEIDPGPTFGHGAHPTTRLCLAIVEELLDGPSSARSVLDVGCGSGVLAVAAAALGATEVVAVDVSPEAVEATRANADRNDVGGVVDVRLVEGEDGTDPLRPASGRWDLVVANIGARALVALAPHLRERLAPGGHLALSGVLDPPPAEVAVAFAPLVVVDHRTLDGWSALVLRDVDGPRPTP